MGNYLGLVVKQSARVAEETRSFVRKTPQKGGLAMKFILDGLTKLDVDIEIANKYRITPTFEPISFAFEGKGEDAVEITRKKSAFVAQVTPFTGRRIYDTNEMKQSNDLYDHLLLLIL